MESNLSSITLVIRIRRGLLFFLFIFLTPDTEDRLGGVTSSASSGSNVDEAFYEAVNEGVEEDGGWEEYYDYIFEDDTSAVSNMKILDIAKKWKMKMKKLKV